jgi:hypothetical protein
VVDRILQTVTDGQRHGAIGDRLRIINGRLQCSEVAGAKGRIDLLELPVFGASLALCAHVNRISQRAGLSRCSITTVKAIGLLVA